MFLVVLPVELFIIGIHCVQSTAPVLDSQPDGDISAHMIAIHGREKKEQEEIDLTARLQAMANIVRKLYVKRL